MICPMTKEEGTSKCAWFKQSRRRYQDDGCHGECSLLEVARLSDRLKEVSASIKALEQTINNKSFVD